MSELAKNHTILRSTIVNILYENLVNHKLLSDMVTCYDTLFDADRSFAKKVVFGVNENKILLEYIIDKYSKLKHDKLDNLIYIVLLSGIYEILYMEKVPEYATVNEYVDIVKKSKLSHLRNYVNAILREIIRNIDKCNKIKNDNNVPYEIRHSIPNDIYKYYKKYNIQVDNDLNKYNYVRIDTFDKTEINNILKEWDSIGIKYHKYDGNINIKYFDIYYVDDIKKVIDTLSFKKGFIYIEDVSSVFMIESIFDIYKDSSDKKIQILDACSSPGGKIIGIEKLFRNKYPKDSLSIIACDINDSKILKINENIKNKNSIIKTYVKDAKVYDPNYFDKFDIVISDLPCSGLGVIKRKPDIAYNFHIDKLKELNKLQYSIINNLKQYVKSNGYMIYSTCTITDEENEMMVDNFLNNNNNFKLIYSKRLLPYSESKSDGFYFAILKNEKHI